MTFDYFHKVTAQDSIDIEDIGNVALQAFTDDGAEYVLAIKTNLGRTSIYQFGPFTAGTNDASGYFKFNYNQFDYNERKLVAIIQKFINNPDASVCITQVFFTDKDEAITRLKEVNLQ